MIYQTNKKKKPNIKEDYSDKALEDFLETLQEQPVKEMNDRRNKWIMFSKRLEKKGAKKRHDECQKQVFTINLLADVSGAWGMQLIFYILKLKILIIVNHCYLMLFFSTHRNDDGTNWPT